MAALRADIATSAAPLVHRLMTARAQAPHTVPAETAGVRAAMLSSFERALTRHEAELAAVAADPAELLDALRQLIDYFLRLANAEHVSPAALVAGFGPAPRLHFKPEAEANLNPA